MIMYVPQLCGLSVRYTPVALRQVYSRLTQRFYREMPPKALASRSILLSRLHCGEKSLLVVKLAPLGISIRAPRRSVRQLFPNPMREERTRNSGCTCALGGPTAPACT